MDQDGGCHCGRLRYRVYATPDVELIGETWSERDIVTEADGSRAWRCFACGVLLFADHPAFGDALRFVRVGTLDEGERITPDAHYFVRSKHPWVVIPEGVPAWDTLPPREAS